MMTIDGTDVIKSQFVEEEPGNHEGFHGIDHVPANFYKTRTNAGNGKKHAFDFLLKPVINLAGHDSIQISCNGSNVRRDGHFVVVKNDQQLLLQMAGLVDPFQSNPTGGTSISNNGYHVMVSPLQVPSHGHS